jgi:acetyl esterase
MAAATRRLDEGVGRVLELFNGPSGPPTVELMRTASSAMLELKGPPEPVDSVVDLSIEGPGGQLGLRFYRPGAAGDPPLLVYLHGGGWVIGNLDTQDSLCRALANRAACAVLSVDYRLAPENPHPAAADDTWAALEWAAANCAQLGADPSRLGIAGDSAGGHLAALGAIMARDRGGPDLRVCAMLCPITDCRCDDRSMMEMAEGYFLTRERMEWYWDQYAPAGIDRTRPELSPLRADLSSLPSTVVVTAGFDPLRDQGVDYARACTAAGTEAVLVHHPGTIHGFLGFQAALPRSRAALDEVAGLIARRFSAA